MPAQSQESKRAGMDAILDMFEEFEDAMEGRRFPYGNILAPSERIALFAAYISRME